MSRLYIQEILKEIEGLLGQAGDLPVEMELAVEKIPLNETMTSKTILTAMLLLILGTLAAEPAEAFYHPQMGPFVNRDPGGQPGFQGK